ncbi:MAG: tRNA (adenosine(37)-N6)-threonylcarbamoyltransferase complex ATPase subunit type 1 TsaE [Thermoguttaceae bacterium]
MSSETYHFFVNSPEETDQIGQTLFDLIPRPSVIALYGTLGAGKTRLVQAIARADHVDPATVSSPTFVLLHQYFGDIPINHIDAYRLKNTEEFIEAGLDSYFNTLALTFVEWADRITPALPELFVRISIRITGEFSRQITMVIPDELPV